MTAIRSFTTRLTLMVFCAISSTGTAPPQPDSQTSNSQTIVYTLDANASQLLRTEDIAAKAGQVRQWQDARQQLQRYLHLAQQYSSSRYAGFGIQMYKNMAEPYRRHPHVQLVFADLLQYSHDFNCAVLNLEQLTQSAAIRTQVQLRLFTIHLIQGNLDGAQQAWKYAQLNWERFKYITDLQLMKKIWGRQSLGTLPNPESNPEYRKIRAGPHAHRSVHYRLCQRPARLPY